MVPAAMSKRLEDAVAHHRAGRLAEAEPIYEEVLRAEPDCADAWQFLGLIALSRGDTTGAVARIGRAIALNPGAGVYHFNLGLALKQRGEIAAAIASYRQAVKLTPGLVEAHSNLGNALRETDDPDGAADAYRRAIALRPTYAEAHVNLSGILYDRGRLEDAETTARRAIALDPQSAIANGHLADVLHAQGRLEEAEIAYRAAIEVDPTLSRPQTHLGHVLLARKDYDGAIGAYRRALALNPDETQAHLGLLRVLLSADLVDDVIIGLRAGPPMPEYAREEYGRFYSAFAFICQRDRRWSDAAEWFAQAIAITPAIPSLHYNQGLALQNQGLLVEAAKSYRRALDLDPSRSEPRKNLAILLLALGFYDETLATYHQGAAACPNDSDFQRLAITTTFYNPALTEAQRYAEVRRFAERYSPPNAQPRVLPSARDPERRLRVGYVSSDFRNHPVSRNLMPLLMHRDRAGFEIVAYSNVASPDNVTAEWQKRVDIWRPILGMTDEEAGQQIAADGIDILVVVAGHFDENRPLLLARRLAPVQISFYDVTTSGLPEADYLLADPALCPRGGQEYFTERVLRPPSIYVHAALDAAPSVGPPPHLMSGAITFGSFSNPAKLNDLVIQIWAGILNAVPASRLVLKYQNWFLSPDLQARVCGAFSGCGVDISRIEFRGATLGLSEHLSAYNQIDISLDPHPFCGPTTTLEALWMGVPVVTLAGTNMMSRWSASMLRVLGLDDLVADTPARYLEIASGLAQDHIRRRELRAGLRDRLRRSPLADGRLRARQVERLYRAVWRRWCRETDT
jgi:predicted O-linked N-acetylglucosamine transferase (SPINDLY family)